MKIKLYNANIYTMNGSFDIIEKGCVIVENGKITKVSKKDIKDTGFDREIDFKGDVLMPGFVNAHAHSAMTLFRGVADDMPLQNWLYDRIFPLEANLTPEHVYWGNYLAFLEYLRGGITTICDMYFYPEIMQKAVGKSGIRCVSVGGATDFGGQAEKEAETLESRYLSLNNACDNFSYMLGVHSEYTTTDELIDKVVGLSYKYKAPIYTHASETLTEVGECSTRNNNLSPVLYFHKMGFFDNGATLAHCVHVDKDDMDAMKMCDVNVVTNPASNLKLASGIAPLYTMDLKGLNIAIGTDGAASNNALSMFREMYLASVLSKCAMNDASAMNAENILKMATANGAKAVFKNDIGRVEEGYMADIIRISTDKPHFKPRNNLTKNLVYTANVGDVAMTMVGGKILYEDGTYNIGESVSDIYKHAERSIKELLRAAKN